MCGIAGMVRLDRRPMDRQGLERMVRSIAHRGPDALACRSYGEGSAGLAHARLAIIDLSTGDQPMTSEDGSLGLVFNGEIYNYLEIRDELAAEGVRFTTRSDTEVILRLYQRYGVDAIPRLRGMFAFAIYDDRTRSLVLARDRLGKKPLFYYRTAHLVLFASEMKAILAALGTAPPVDWSFLGDYLALGYIPEPATPFASIRKLPAAHALVFGEGREVPTRYWSPPRFEPRVPPEAAAERLRRVLSEAVELRLRSDVDFGSLLSSGVDSSLVTALMCHSGKLGGRARTFSVGFEAKSHNELPGAATIAGRLGTDHHQEVLRIDAAGVLPRIAWHMEEPFADSSAIPTYYVCAMAARHVKMVLSGDGGDELFSGYQRYRRVAQLAQLRHGVAGPLARAAARLSSFLPGGQAARRLDRYLRSSPEAAYAELVGIFPPDSLARMRIQLPGGYPPAAIADPWRSNGGADLDRAMFTDLTSYLRDDVLIKVDRMSMAHSLEVRSPILDHQVVELASGIPLALKRPRAGRGKVILRDLAANFIPREILDRPKHGFSAPVDDWYRHELREPFQAELSQGEEVLERLDRAEIDRLISSVDGNLPAGGEKLFVIHTLLLWHRLFVEELGQSLSTYSSQAGARLGVEWEPAGQRA